MRTIFFVLALCLAGTGAHAQSDGLGQALEESLRGSGGDRNIAETLRSYGLTGTWSIDCSQPKGPGNARVEFRRIDGKIVQVHDIGSRDHNMYEIREAVRLESDRLRVKALFSNSQAKEANTMEWVVRDKRMRTFSNTSESGDRIVVDGLVVRVKRETPWLTQCN